MYLAKTFALFAATALAEIVGCYLPYLWLRKEGSAWYGGVYVSMAILWLWQVDGVRPTAWDLAGIALMLAGMAVVMLGPARAA